MARDGFSKTSTLSALHPRGESSSMPARADFSASGCARSERSARSSINLPDCLRVSASQEPYGRITGAERAPEPVRARLE